ncbi:MAG TPA: hypothetical protein VJC12_03455 [Candidatus Paceibacterota bacterium]
MNDLYFDGKKFISSSRAAKLTGYVNDYIGQLCRDEKLECRIVGRSWYVSLESLLEHKNKVGNGVTSRSSKHVQKVIFLEKRKSEEIKKIGSKFYPKAQKTELEATAKEVSGGINQSYSLRETQKQKSEIKIPIITNIVLDVPEKDIKKTAYFHQYKRNLTDIFPKAVLTILSLFISLMSFWVALESNPAQEFAYKQILSEVRETELNLVAKLSGVIEANALSGINLALDNTRNSVKTFWSNFYNKTKNKILTLIGKNKFANNILSGAQPKQGIVVVPVDKETNKEGTIAKIKNSFSDEVTVSPSAKGSDGIIRPVFKEVKDDEYLYVLVPIKN